MLCSRSTLAVLTYL